MTEPLLHRVVRVLEHHGIRYALIGAAAMAAHGVSRSTYDTDLFSVGQRALDDDVWRALSEGGVDVDLRHGDDDDPLLGVVRCSDGDQAIDLVVGRSRWQQDLIERAKPTRALSLDLPIVTLEDLIVLKLYAGGLQDRWDIQQLLALADTEALITTVDARVQALPQRCQLLWTQLRPA